MKTATQRLVRRVVKEVKSKPKKVSTFIVLRERSSVRQPKVLHSSKVTKVLKVWKQLPSWQLSKHSSATLQHSEVLSKPF